jgi:hypothetical protein
MSTESISKQDEKTFKDNLYKMRQSWTDVTPRIRDFFVHVLGQVRILRKAYPGIMHLLIFWGVTIQVVGTAVNLMQMALFIPFVELPFPRGSGYHIYELVMDLAGVDPANDSSIGWILHRRIAFDCRLTTLGRLVTSREYGGKHPDTLWNDT